MCPPHRLARAWLACLLLAPSGCAEAIPLLTHVARPDTVTASPPGEDGTRYLAIEGGPLSSARTLRTRWSATARKICRGEVQRLSESATTRRAAGVARARIHEGYFQCLLPDESEPGAPGAPTVAEATAQTPRRPRLE